MAYRWPFSSHNCHTREITGNRFSTELLVYTAVPSIHNGRHLNMAWKAGYSDGNVNIKGKGIVLASRASGHHLDTQTLENHPFGHPNIFMMNFNFKHITEFIHLDILPNVP